MRYELVGPKLVGLLRHGWLLSGGWFFADTGSEAVE
jgi:hypothetical protein